MENQSRIITLIFLLSLVLIACKVQKAPGAYAPAKSKIPQEKLKQVASDSVVVVTEPDRVVRVRSGNETVDSTSQDFVAVEPSTDVVADPEPIIEVIPVDTVNTDTVDSLNNEVPEEPIEKNELVEQSVTRFERFTVVEGQGNVELKTYHVVIGSFGKQENAVNLQSQMKPEYEPILVVNERGMYRVLLVSFDTYQEAKEKIAEILDQFPDAWCLVQQNN